MSLRRRHLRIADTQDLLARLRFRGRHEAADRVLNLSEGGVLVAGGELDVGEIVSFELSGPREFRFAGLAAVAHSSNGATGLRFLNADASADREIEDLIATRMLGQRLESSAITIPGLYLG
jgi:PilZ domain-containing protein